MPQLSPTPWFLILLASWLIFIFLAPSKILGHADLNNFTPYNKNLLSHTWLWPW